MQKTKFNGQIINRIKRNFYQTENIKLNKFEEKEIPNKLKVNLSSTLKNSIKKSHKKEIISSKFLYLKIVSNNLKKYNSLPQTKNVMAINNLIKCKSCHFLAKFKDFLIIDYVEEFLRRLYFKKESIERIPKIYIYYKNYLKFFCKPTFIVSFANEILKNYSDLNAEYFYKNNLNKKNTKRRRKKEDNKIIDDDNNNNYGNIIKEINLENKKPFVKTVFTKSIKNSIDNINIDDFSLSEKNFKKFSKNEGISIVKNFGNDEDDTNLFLNSNSLLLMINEIKDVKDNNNNTKPIMKEKVVKKNNNINNNNIVNNRYTFIDTQINNNLITIQNRNKKINKRNSNLEKANTCENDLHFESIKNLIYSPKSNKKGVFILKKDSNNKIERYFSPKAEKVNSQTIQKNPNSIIVNINININTNQDNLNHKKNSSNKIMNNNLVYKSPSHQISKSKKVFSFSPLSSTDITNYKYDKPLLTARNEETKESNYLKIEKRKNNYNNMILNTDRNIKNQQKKKTRKLSSIKSFDFNKVHNYSCNKDNILTNKQIFSKKIKEMDSPKQNKININYKELYSSNNNIINKNVYFSPNKFVKKQKLNNINKIIETNNGNKRFVYHKKSNNTLGSPLNKNEKFNNKYFQMKKV